MQIYLDEHPELALLTLLAPLSLQSQSVFKHHDGQGVDMTTVHVKIEP